MNRRNIHCVRYATTQELLDAGYNADCIPFAVIVTAKGQFSRPILTSSTVDEIIDGIMAFVDIGEQQYAPADNITSLEPAKNPLSSAFEGRAPMCTRIFAGQRVFESTRPIEDLERDIAAAREREVFRRRRRWHGKAEQVPAMLFDRL